VNGAGVMLTAEPGSAATIRSKPFLIREADYSFSAGRKGGVPSISIFWREASLGRAIGIETGSIDMRQSAHTFSPRRRRGERAGEHCGTAGVLKSMTILPTEE